MKGKIAAGSLLALVLTMSAWFVSPIEGTKLTGYQDVIGIATACTGHAGKDVVVGKKYTPEQCEEWLKSDLAVAATGVDECVTVDMTSYQWTALTSLAFNIGVPAFCKSSVARFANAGNWTKACESIELYKYAGGRVVQGLVKRRKSERAMCEGRT